MASRKRKPAASPTVIVEHGHDRDREREKGKRWMSASPIAIITLCLTLAFNVGQIGFTYAYVLGRLDANALATKQVADDVRERNLTALRLIEDRHTLVMGTLTDYQNRAQKAIDKLDTSMGAMSALRTDVEVVKNKLTGIDDTLRRVERQWDRNSDRNSERFNNEPAQPRAGQR